MPLKLAALNFLFLFQASEPLFTTGQWLLIIILVIVVARVVS